MKFRYRFGSVESQFFQITVLQAICFTIIYSDRCRTSFFMSKNDKPLHCDNANSVSVLIFRDSNLQSLSDASFNDFRRVEKLFIWNCVFPNTTRSLFAGLKSLKIVTISSSIMPSDIGSMFAENTLVQSLSLTDNNLTTVKGNLSFHFPVVDSIDLKQNKIEEIRFESPTQKTSNSVRGGFSHLEKVTVINLCKNAIKYLRNYTFTNLASINKLDLSFNVIRKIEEAAISMPSESDNVTINIANNELREVRRFMFYLCSGVTKLYLMHNRISRLENRAFSGLVRLKELSLKNNSIPSILPGAFESLLSLKVLDISDNLLKTIPANAFYECKNVTKIFLSGNQIGKIHPLALEGLISLRELLLEANEVSDLDSIFTTPLPNLKTVNLQRNRISEVLTRAFEGCLAMEDLDLSKNRIYLIENGAFSSNVHLRQLNLEHNNIQVLSCACFLNLSSLESLNLDGNALKFFRLSYFSPLRSLKQLTVQLGRYSECECSLFMKLHQQKVHIDVEVTQMSESCKLYYYAYTSSIYHLAEECIAEIVEQCHWEPTTTEYSKTTDLQNVSTVTCPECTSEVETHESNASKPQQQNVERADSPVEQTVFTPQTSEFENLKTPTSMIQRPKEKYADFPVAGTSPTPQTTAPPQHELRDNDATPSTSTVSNQTEGTTHVTSTQATEESQTTSNSNNREGNVSEGRSLGLSASHIAYSLGGGVVAGVVFGCALWVVIRASRNRGKRTGAEGGVPEVSTERHLYEEIDEGPSVERVPLNPMLPSSSSVDAGGARGTDARVSVELEPPELPPRPRGKKEIGEARAMSQSDSQLSSRAYLYVMK